jgi:two-component system, OmpR family, response regulator CpxR
MSHSPESRPARRLLVIDDDVELCGLVAEFLRREGIEAELVHDGVAGLEAALSGRHEAIILDVMLPGLGGFEVLRRIREQKRTPVLMLTARGDHVDRIVGLEMGADDYIPKPFDPRELVARIRAVLRRSEAPPAPSAAPAEDGDWLVVGDIKVDLAAREARRGSRAVQLTPFEFDLLVALMRSVGRLLTRDQLSRTVLGRPYSPDDRNVDAHIAKLRQKLGKGGDGASSIRTVRSAGYLLSRPRDGDAR